MKKRMAFAATILFLTLTAYAQAPKAGRISAVLPQASVERGSGAGASKTQAKKGADLLLNDVVRTNKEGRARMVLLDSSILSIGSGSELRITKHDPAAQQTSLELHFGLLRAQVSKLTRGGKLELTTPTAVAGVIGTDFGVDASDPDVTKFICIQGDVELRSADPNIPGTVRCSGGHTVTVRKGKPPDAPQDASGAQMDRWKMITEPEKPDQQYQGPPY